MNRHIERYVIMLIMALLLFSCNAEKRTLNVYNWVDYIDPQVVLQFETEFNCAVKIHYFASNEELHDKIQGGAVYDVTVPSSFMAMDLKKHGLIRKLDHTRLPGLNNLDPEFMTKHPDPQSEYTVPYMMSFIGIGYDSRRVKNFRPSWSQFGRKDLKGRMTLLHDMRPVIGAALKYSGFSINSTNEKELSIAGEIVRGWKNNIARFAVDDAKAGLASGEFDLVHNYSGDILQLQKENEFLVFAIPEEGTSINDDDLVISASAVEVDLAYTFINFLLRPDICAKNMIYICYLAPNPAAVKLMPESFRKNRSIFPGRDIMARCEVMKDLGRDNEKYVKVWKTINAEK